MRCSYAIKAESCISPCRNKDDDMPAFHQMLAASKVVIIASLSTGTAFQENRRVFLTGQPAWRSSTNWADKGLQRGRLSVSFVCGYMDGAIRTAMDIRLELPAAGDVPAPLGIAFMTRGFEFSSSTHREFFRNN